MVLPGYLKQFTIAYYLQALVPHAMPSEGLTSLLQGFFRETPSLSVSLFWLVAYTPPASCGWPPAWWSAGNMCSSNEGCGRIGGPSLASALSVPDERLSPDEAPASSQPRSSWAGTKASRIRNTLQGATSRRMTKKTRNFVLVSGAILTIGLGTGLVASYLGLPGLAALQRGWPGRTAVRAAECGRRGLRERAGRDELGVPPAIPGAGAPIGGARRVRAEDRPEDRSGHRLDRRGLHPAGETDDRPAGEVRRRAGPRPLRSGPAGSTGAGARWNG